MMDLILMRMPNDEVYQLNDIECTYYCKNIQSFIFPSEVLSLLQVDANMSTYTSVPNDLLELLV